MRPSHATTVVLGAAVALLNAGCGVDVQSPSAPRALSAARLVSWEGGPDASTLAASGKPGPRGPTGLRTLHVYEMGYDRKDPERIALGTQDNGSWETLGDRETWVKVNVADGGHNAFDPAGGDPEFALTAFQAGQLSVRYRPLDQVDVNWIADTLVAFPSPYRFEGVPFIGNAITDTLTPGWMWTGREHVFRSTNWGRNPVLTKDTHRLHCSV